MNKPIFYDTDCLESFLIVDAGYILEELFSKIIIPEQVYNEIMSENTPSIVKTNFRKLKDGFIEIREINFTSKEYWIYKSIEKGFWSETGQICGSGESAAITLAHLNNGIVASNNLRDVYEYVESLGIEIITSSMILTEGVKKDIISEDNANSFYLDMIDNGILLPCESYYEYYEKLYEEDCMKFLKDKHS